MISENALADLFDEAVRDLDPAVNAILLRAEQRGRRWRARRRTGRALGSGLAVAVLAGTALAARVPLDHQAARLAGTAHRQQAGTHAETSHAPPAPARNSSPPGRAGTTYPTGALPTLAPGYQTSAEHKLTLLRRLLPAGSTLTDINPYTAQDGTLEADYNDGRGAVDIQISVDPTATFTPLNCPTPLWPDESPRPAGALPATCAMRTLPAGGIERDAVYNTDAYGYYAFSVYDQRPDGVTVDIQVGNGIIHTLPQVDRARPPGTLTEWEAIAENPVWQLRKGWHLED